jgi:glycosyltransferase involved in cell wall biosynthesis
MLKKDECEIVHVNPSLAFKALLREGIFLLLTRMYKKKAIVFFRGWQKSFESSIGHSGLWLFRFLYGKIQAFIVLSEEFKNTLEAWGFTQPIYHEVTVTDDDALQGFDIHKTITERLKSENWHILFLSRIFLEKGIYQTIEAVSILRTKYPRIQLIVAGDGAELQRVKSFVRNRSICNVSFAGHVRGEEKTKLLKSAHVLCFPTHHGEGLPNTVVESMAFGLPIVTRLVGGIADFFHNGEHGFATTSKEPKVFAHLLETLYIDKELYKTISFCNYEYAKSNFLAAHAVLRLEDIYRSVMINS